MSGWAWGASPEALVQAATRALPDLIAARLPAIAASVAAPITITRPIRVKLETTIPALVALHESKASPLAELIAAEVARAVEQAIGHEPASDTLAESTVERETIVTAVAEPARGLDDADTEAPRRAVRSWWRSGAIEQVLARLDQIVVARLHARLLQHVPTTAAAARAELVAIAEAIAARIPLARWTADERARVRIAIAAALLDASPAARDVEIAAAVDRVMPHLASGAPDVQAPPTEVSAPPSAPRVAHSPRTGTIEIRSVLPFLLLPSLHHARWLDTGTTLLAANDLDDLAFALAAGLAAKVLDPPVRSWSRTPADRAVIAAFAGVEDAPEDRAVASAAQRLVPIFDALDASLRAVLTRARRPRPLVLARDEHVWHVLDGSGMIVLASHAVLRSALTTTASPVLVPAPLADPATLDQLDLLNVRFITDAAPTRGEAWRRFRGVSAALATNDTETSTDQLVALTADFEHTIAMSIELVEFLAARPSVPRDPRLRLDATCTLAATAALADLGARLFPGEPTTPILGLTRFRDLDATVTFEPDRIRVRVPLGRRHADLMRHGILGELANIPWLGERTLDLGGA
jgi:hypothetical protein